MKRLFLSNRDKKIAGVGGGIAEYFEVDPTMVRLLIVFIALITAVFPALIAYLIAWVIIPKKDEAEIRSEPLDFGSGYNQPK